MNVKMWLAILCCLFTLGIGILFTSNAYISNRVFDEVTLPQISSTLKSRYEYGLKHTVELAAQTLADSLKDVKSPEEKYALVEKMTDSQRFFPDGEGYLFTYKIDGTRINVPVNKTENGQNLMGLVDSDGAYFIKDIIETAKKGGGFVSYRFDKPGFGVQPKLSYAQMIPGTEIVIGTGVYVDSIEKEQAKIVALTSEKLAYYERIQSIMMAVLLVSILCLSWGIYRLICPPLRKLTKESEEVSAGRLDKLSGIPRSSPVEIRALHASLTLMIDNLRKRADEAAMKTKEAADALQQAEESALLAKEAQDRAESAHKEGLLTAARQLEGIAEIISSASSQLSSQIEQSDKGATDSALRLVEVATAMNEMNTTVQEVAKNAGLASEASSETRDKAISGAGIVQNVVNSILQVHTHSLELKKDMEKLDEHSQSIGAIINVISDIADQTNLLALNAAIEAARAGDAGRGFAVVADEVRKLAEKTMTSTSDVSRAIESIQESVQKSMESVENAVRTIGEATSLSNESGAALEEIVSTVDATADQVRAIATASEQQSAASEEINRAVVEVNTMSGQTAAAMNEAAKVVDNLEAQAHSLTDIIREMKESR